MDTCSLRQDQQRGRARWWRSRLRSETGGSEQGRYILRPPLAGRLRSSDNCRARRVDWRLSSRHGRSCPAVSATGRRRQGHCGNVRRAPSLGRVLIKTDDSSAIVDRCLLSSHKRRKSGHFHTAASCRYCCKTILRIRVRKIDSRLGANAQR
jgi:hypothetical protein